jgi:hypothetical protein
MRRWTIPILSVVALALAAPSTANTRPRFGPAGLLGVMTAPFGAIFGGHRHSFRHHHRSAARPTINPRGNDNARAERPPAQAAPAAPPSAAAPPSPVFWPGAATDLVEYLLFPGDKGGARFWSYDYGTILSAAFAAGDADDAQHTPHLASGDSEAVSPKALEVLANRCDHATAEADAVVERIAQAIQPTASQRELLETLRTALAQAAACDLRATAQGDPGSHLGHA